MAQTNGSLPMASFSFNDSLLPYNIPMNAWLSENNKQNELDGLATANIVISSTDDKVLLVQRAAHDSFPGRWEVPGGAVDPEDPSVLHAAARELFEESGLIAARFTHIVAERSGLVGGYVFQSSRKTSTWCRFTFAVEVDDCAAVKIDPNEHQDYLWATEEEVRERKVGERDVPITTDNMAATILEAFRLRREKPTA